MSEKNIKDSGETREFSTGSHRDSNVGKGRCDLLPGSAVLEVLGRKSHAAERTVSGIMQEAYKNIVLFTCNTEKNADNLIQAAAEALIAVGLDEGQNLPGANLDSDAACMAIGLMMTSKHYEAGAIKYGENNWKFGQPTHVLIDSGERHSLKGIAGINDEPHLRAAAWNLLCCIWTRQNLPELDDLPVTSNCHPSKVIEYLAKN